MCGINFSVSCDLPYRNLPDPELPDCAAAADRVMALRGHSAPHPSACHPSALLLQAASA